MFTSKDLHIIGKIEDNVSMSGTQSLNRDELTLALRDKLKRMKVDQSFLISCTTATDIVKYRAKAFTAAKDADCFIATRHRKQRVHGENGLRVWKRRKPHQKAPFSLKDSGQ